jgi:Mrr N-terminal domain
VRITREEEIAVLYALHCHGGSATKSEVVELILRNKLLRPRSDDELLVATGEPRIVNRIAWTRQNLKAKGELTMPRHGTWRITSSGLQRLFRFACSLEEATEIGLRGIDLSSFERLSSNFLSRLRALAKQDVEP